MLHAAVHDLWWLALAGGGAAARYVQVAVRRRPEAPRIDATVLSFLLDQQQRYGYNAHSLVSLTPTSHFWRSSSVAGAVVYNEFGKVWLVAGDPMADPGDAIALTREFIAAAASEQKVAVFMPATERFALSAPSLGLRAVKIGAAPYFDLSSWAPRGDRAKKARAGINQARRAGVQVQALCTLTPSLQNEILLLCERWLSSRRCRTRFGWLFALDPLQNRHLKNYFGARDGAGRLVGLLAASPIPARKGWYLEDVIRAPDAPMGTTELLVSEALQKLASDGAQLATLGTIPLATEGDVSPDIGNHIKLSRAIRAVVGLLRPIYNFEGLRRFKGKFAPSWWESEYLLFPRTMSAPPHVLRAFVNAIVPDGATRLISQEIAGMLAFARNAASPSQELDDRSEELGTSRRAFTRAMSGKLNYAADDLSHERAGRYLGQFVSVDGIQLHYVSKGSGRPVVLLHGNPGSHQDFSSLLTSDLVNRFRVLAIDRAGHGFSQRPVTRISLQQQAELVNTALDHLNVEKPLLVGHSWGGSAALAMVLQRPTAFAGLLLLAPAAYPSNNSNWWSGLVETPILGSLLLRGLAPIIGPREIKNNLKQAYYPQRVDEEYIATAIKMWMRPSQIRACAQDDASLNKALAEMEAGYCKIRLPVVIVTGDLDGIVNSEEQAARLHQTVPYGKLIRLPQAGHEIQLTHPNDVIAAIEAAWRMSQDFN